MTFSRWLLPAVAAPLILSGCGGFGEAMTAHTDVVARAAGKELRVEEAAQLLASNPQIPADPQVARALADVWVDYTLLATAVAEDSALGAIDLDAFTEPVREQTLMLKLREEVIHPDTTFTAEEMRRLWNTEGPGVEVRARHILLRIPAEATPAQRDSVRQLAESLRQRTQGGEDFAALAQEFSQDPGSGQRGGDLGFFGRGRMVAPFEEAAFALEPGQVGEVVESPFGYHVIKLEERRQPELGEQEEQFRQFLVQRAVQDAETAYMDSLAAGADVQVQPGGLAVVREIASRPEMSLRGRAAEREIARYQGGNLTTGEFVDFIRTQAPQVQSAFATATDEQIESAVQQLVRRELLLQQARAHDISLTREEEESVRAEARIAIQQLLQASGLADLAGQRAPASTIDARVKSLLQDAVGGRAQLVPLGRLGQMLRDLYPSEINEGTFPQVVSQLETLRAGQPPLPPTGGEQIPMPEPMPVPPVDTAR